MKATATQPRARGQRAAPDILRYARTDPAKDALDDALRSALTGNEYKAIRPLIRTGTFTGTVCQHAAASGLSKQQCDRARRALKSKNVIAISYNAKRGCRRHNSTVTLNDRWAAAQRKRGLISTKSRENNGLQAQSINSESAIYSDTFRPIDSESIIPPRSAAAVSPPPRKEVRPAEVFPSSQDHQGPSAIVGVAKAGADASTGLALDKLRAPARPEGAGVHPSFASPRGPVRGWRDMPNLTPAQRLVHLWEDMQGRKATPREKGVLALIAGKRGRVEQVDHPEEFLTWVVGHWQTIGEGPMDWAGDYPEAPSLLWLKKHLMNYQRAHMHKDKLDWMTGASAERGRREFERRLGIEKRPTKREEQREREREALRAELQKRPDWRLIRGFMSMGRNSLEEARDLVDRDAHLYANHPLRDRIIDLRRENSVGGGVDRSVEECVTYAEAEADGRLDGHPCPDVVEHAWGHTLLDQEAAAAVATMAWERVPEPDRSEKPFLLIWELTGIGGRTMYVRPRTLEQALEYLNW